MVVLLCTASHFHSVHRFIDRPLFEVIALLLSLLLFLLLPVARLLLSCSTDAFAFCTYIAA